MDHSLDEILSLCKKHVESWGSVTGPDNITATRMSGLSNACYRVTIKSEQGLDKVQPQNLLLRFFQTEIVDLRIENSIFQIMSDEKNGPFCYYCDSKYRVEEFVLSRPITIFEMRNPIFLEMIGKFFAQFAYHKKITESLTQLREGKTDTCTDTFFKEDGWWTKLKNKREELDQKITLPKHKAIWEQVKEFVFTENFEQYFNERIPTTSDVVVAHYDCQENNILLNKAYPPLGLTIIDFEYGNFAYRAWDLANYYNETAFDNDAVVLYLENYIEDEEKDVMNRAFLNQYFKEQKGLDGEALEKSVEEELPQLRKEIQGLMIVNNIYWCVWAILMIRKDEDLNDESIFNFDFARDRIVMNEFLSKKGY